MKNKTFAINVSSSVLLYLHAQYTVRIYIHPLEHPQCKNSDFAIAMSHF